MESNEKHKFTPCIQIALRLRQNEQLFDCCEVNHQIVFHHLGNRYSKSHISRVRVLNIEIKRFSPLKCFSLFHVKSTNIYCLLQNSTIFLQKSQSRG